MNLYINPQNVSWKFKSTSNELDTYTIISPGGNNEYPELYNVTQTGLVIKNATTTDGNGNPISTAGLYYAQCTNNPNRTGAKLLVVRKFFYLFYSTILFKTSQMMCNMVVTALGGI